MPLPLIWIKGPNVGQSYALLPEHQHGSNVMTAGELAYLSLIIFAFAAFCGTLGRVSWHNP